HQPGIFRLPVTGSRDPLGARKRPAPIASARRIPSAERNAEQVAAIRRHFREHESKRLESARSRLAAIKTRLEEIDRAIPTTMVMEEMSQPRETFVLMRGQYDKPGERVTANVPAVLPALPDGAPRNRLGLAQWLVDPQHPLTSRVIVNRYWQLVFGSGLVKTVEDFGSQGELPS